MGRMCHKPAPTHVFFKNTSKIATKYLKIPLKSPRRAAYNQRVFCERTPTVCGKKRKKKKSKTKKNRPQVVQYGTCINAPNCPTRPLGVPNGPS